VQIIPLGEPRFAALAPNPLDLFLGEATPV
jgi:hypothetical protein